jgi:hypothetical protein
VISVLSSELNFKLNSAQAGGAAGAPCRRKRRANQALSKLANTPNSPATQYQVRCPWSSRPMIKPATKAAKKARKK